MAIDWKEQLPLDYIKDITPVSGGDVNEDSKLLHSKMTHFSY